MSNAKYVYNFQLVNIFLSIRIQGDSRIVSDLAPLFLQYELLFSKILRCFSI
jgi:hypothetical protein